jgi:hypothetical protein
LLKYLIVVYRRLMRTLLALLAFVLAIATPAIAQAPRLLPTNGKLGHIGQQQQFPLVEIDRKVLRLAPGGVIVDQNNRFIVHSALPGETEALYVLDGRGDVSRIILLTANELAQHTAKKR